MKFIIDNIKCSYADARGGIGSIWMENRATGLCNIFQHAIALLLPTDPVLIKRREKHMFANVLSTTALKEVKGILVIYLC